MEVKTRHRLHPGSIFPGILAGFVVAGLTITLTLSLATLIFSGNLAGFLPAGMRIALFSAVAVGIVGVLTGSLPGTIVVPQSAPAAILALIAASISLNLGADADPYLAFVTVIAAIGLATVITGIFFLFLGILRLGALIRFVPYPVFGGFLAGTGWLLVQGALQVMAGVSPELSKIPVFMEQTILQKWLPGALFALLLLVAIRRSRHFLVMPAAILGGLLLFYVTLYLGDISIPEAIERGWLLGGVAGTEFKVYSLDVLSSIDWRPVLSQVGSLGAILFISGVDLLFSASALELATAEDVDLNMELRSAGLANLLSGAGCGIIGYQSMTFTILSRQISPASRRLAGFVAIGTCAATLVWGADFMTLFPKPILGGLLMFLGLSFMAEWLWDARERLARPDYFIVILILIIIGIKGFLAGVGVGVVVAVVLFVVKYSRIDIVKHDLSGAVHHSNVDRSAEHRQILIEKGRQISILKLQGFIFFGTANLLLERFKARADNSLEMPLRYAILDFRGVSDLDSSAVFGFVRMCQLAKASEVRLIFSSASDQIRRRLEKGGLGVPDDSVFSVHVDLDHALEWCEDGIIAGEKQQSDTAARTLIEHFQGLIPAGTDTERLLAYMDRKAMQPGDVMIQQGDPPDVMYFIESGRVTAQLELSRGRSLRLRSMGSGTVVGEIGLYLEMPRTATVVADQAGVAYCLTADALQRLEDESPELAAAFHHFMARLLAQRLQENNTSLNALLD